MRRTSNEMCHGSCLTLGRGRTLRFLSRKVLRAVSIVALLTACGGSDDGGPTAPPPPSGSDPVLGAFTLTTVNSGPLPFTLFSEGGFKLEMTASTMAMQAGGQFVMATTTRETVAGFPSTYVDSTRGTWTQNAGAVTLTANGSSAAATWDGTRLAFQMTGDPGVLSLVYRKDP